MTAPAIGSKRGTAARLHGFAASDVVFRVALTGAALAVPLLLGLLAWELVVGSRLAIEAQGLRFLTTSTWDPVAGQFGAVPLIFGTVISSLLALLIAVPLSLGVAIFCGDWSHCHVERNTAGRSPTPAT